MGERRAGQGEGEGKGCSSVERGGELDRVGSMVHGTVLVGDIGGTNARLQLRQLVSSQPTPLHSGAERQGRGRGTAVQVKSEPLFVATLKREKYARFEDALNQFLTNAAEEVSSVSRPSKACFAVAGIVNDNRCDMTNSPWIIDGNTLRDEFDIESVAVINDFEAVGHGVAALMQHDDADENEDVVTLLQGQPTKGGPVLVLGPGTGLGVCQLFYDVKSKAYTVMASEGGHAEFAPRTQEQREIQAWIQNKLGYCEIESILSGNGLERLYAFYSGNEIDAASVSGAALSLINSDKSSLFEEADPVAATNAARSFLSILGASAGNISLMTFAQGGVFVAGGITPKLMAVARKYHDIEDGFLHKKCRYHDVLAKMPLKVILEEFDVGLRGALHYATNLI